MDSEASLCSFCGLRTKTTVFPCQDVLHQEEETMRCVGCERVGQMWCKICTFRYNSMGKKDKKVVAVENNQRAAAAQPTKPPRTKKKGAKEVGADEEWPEE